MFPILETGCIKETYQAGNFKVDPEKSATRVLPEARAKHLGNPIIFWINFGGHFRQTIAVTPRRYLERVSVRARAHRPGGGMGKRARSRPVGGGVVVQMLGRGVDGVRMAVFGRAGALIGGLCEPEPQS